VLFSRFCRTLTGTLPRPAPTLVLGISGGLDSMALLDLACRARRAAPDAYRLVGAHLHHSLRGVDADRDAELCRRTCETQEVPFVADRVDVRALARTEGIGIEEAGRLARHRFFARLARKHGSAWILLAHHADDQVETIQMHMLRGAGLRGLSGMRTVRKLSVEGLRFTVFRPLLETWREEIRAYAADEHLTWREDRSNQDPTFLRNRVRHEFLPLYEEVTPQYRERLLALAKSAALAQTTLEARARQLLAQHLRATPGGVLLSLPDARQVDPALLGEVFCILCEEHFGRPPRGESGFNAFRALATDGRTGAVIHLPTGLRVRRETDGLFFHVEEDAPLPARSEIVLPDDFPFRIRTRGLSVFADTAPGAEARRRLREEADDAHVEWFDISRIRLPLVVRPREAGDTFRPLGAPGQKRIKNLLIDEHVPQRMKDRVRVVTDRSGPLWCWPVRTGHRARVLPDTVTALRLHIRPDWL
jgi:tRNA(Ile)-lysidine synthase